MEEVRRASDGELCGFVAPVDGGWVARTVFGADLGRHPDRDAAAEHVLAEGLAVLADRWILRHVASGDEEIVCIQEASAETVTVALGYYSLPGVPSRRITVAQLATGEWELRR